MKESINPNIRDEVAEEADLIHLQGGEIPEVAMFDALENLRLMAIEPTGGEISLLEKAVVGRYEDIILRDLEPANRERPEFRTPERAFVNWRRLWKFAQDKGLDIEKIRSKTASMLEAYLAVEADEISEGKSFNTLGVSGSELIEFMDEIGIEGGRCRDLAETVTAVPTKNYGM